MATSIVTFNRPSNTTAYAAGDVVGAADAGTPANAGSAVLTFRNLGSNRRMHVILGASLRIDATSIPSGMTSFRLHLSFRQPDAILDNAAWVKTSTNDKTVYAGFIDFTPAVVGGDLWAKVDAINMPIQIVEDSSAFYGELVTNGGFTPASGTLFEVELFAMPVES